MKINKVKVLSGEDSLAPLDELSILSIDIKNGNPEKKLKSGEVIQLSPMAKNYKYAGKIKNGTSVFILRSDGKSLKALKKAKK